jgi:Sigma-70, region 4
VDVIQDAPGIRARRFSCESFQRTTPSLPCPRVETRGNARRWRWIIKNWRGIVAAFRRTWWRIQKAFTNQDIIAYLAPYVLESLKNWQKGGGASRFTYVWNGIRNRLWRDKAILYPSPGFSGIGKAKIGPLLLGDYTPEPDGSFEHDREPPGDLLDLLDSAWRTIDARRRIAIAMWLGMDGPIHTFREIGHTLGVSKERVSQLIETGIIKLRKAMGYAGDKPALPRTGSVGRRPKAEYKKAASERYRFKKSRRELLDAGATDSL